MDLTDDVRSELLDPAAWEEALEQYARSTGLAVTLTDPEGRLLGPCYNRQPVWSLARNARPPAEGECPFCLSPPRSCGAMAEAVRTGQQVLVVDSAKLAHVAVPLWLDGERVGGLLAGQVFAEFPEQLPIERIAREYQVSPQTLWQIARTQRPFGRDRLRLCGELLATLGQSFLQARFGLILERRRAAEVLALSRDVAEHKRLVAAVRESQRFLRSSLDALTSHIAVLDQNGIILEVNEAWRRFSPTPTGALAGTMAWGPIICRSAGRRRALEGPIRRRESARSSPAGPICSRSNIRATRRSSSAGF
jgi:PAS domain-containing protein